MQHHIGYARFLIDFFNTLLEHAERIDVGEWIPDLLEMDHRIQLAKERSDAERAARLAQEKARDIRE